MKIQSPKSLKQAGNTLVTVAVIGGVLSIVAAGMLSLSSTGINESYTRADYNTAYFHAKNALVWASQYAVDNQLAAGSSNYYSTQSNTLQVPYMTSRYSPQVPGTAGAGSQFKDAVQMGFKNAWVSIVNTNSGLSNIFLVTASAKVNNKVRTLQASVSTYPPSQVFDYEYFLNNWGWWWGSTITGNGGQRANWDFDFQGSPQVNGAIYAANQIDENEVPYTQFNQAAPFGGLAGNNPLYYCHAGAARVVMPNLLSFSNYIATALLNTNKNGIWQSNKEVVLGVQGNTNKPGFYILGSPAAPVCITNTVVIPGDLVIGGVITGRGCVYVGGNLYVCTNLTYANGPDYSTPPETMSSSNCNSWVSQNSIKDLVAFAVRGSVFAGDVTSSDWYNWCFSFPGSGLQNVGDESQLGQDGIQGTPDDGVPFLHPDGTYSSWYDADGDGVCESNYNYNTQITMTTVGTGARASYILNYPTNTDGTYQLYSLIANNNMGTLEGIFYTDHAAAMRLANSTAIFHGVVVSRNEQIVFQNYLNFTYDSRVNSRYNNNPNTIINLGLPFGKKLTVNTFAELSAITTGL